MTPTTMADFLVPYASTLAACVALSALILVQVLVADVAGMRAKHVPGMPVTDGHRSFFFRAVRAHANTTENLGVFVLLVLAALALGARAGWTGALVWAFVAARALHMACYYADWRLARSVAFGAGLLAQFGLLAVCALALP